MMNTMIRGDFSSRGSSHGDNAAPLDPGVDPHLSSKGRYRICMELASGGMGAVYVALYRGTDGFERVVALKRMHSHLSAQAEFVKMFFDEAQLLARVKHPAVCSLIDLGKTEDSYFLVMEYVTGEPLAEIAHVLSKRHRDVSSCPDRLPLLAARIFARLSEGLHAVHETHDERGRPLNIVHRDITPQNLFVLYDGTVRLMDFGIAHSEAALHRTGAGVVMGKVGYLAPEQLMQHGPADRRWDIWSMGVVLWEILTGRRLFTGKALGSAPREIAELPIPVPSTYNRDVLPALDTVVMRALERDPKKRYQTARELGLALERVLAEAGDSVPAAHVADWLEALFPGRAIEKRGIRAMAQAMGSALCAPSVAPRGSSAAPARYASFQPLDDDSSGSLEPITALEMPLATSRPPASKLESTPRKLITGRSGSNVLLWRRLALGAAWLALFALSFYVAIQIGSLGLSLIDRGGAPPRAVANAH
jgi:serine/threonine protein kinase